MIRQILSEFLRDCKSRALSWNTVEYYRRQITFFQEYCENQGITDIEDVTTDVLRSYFISLDGAHNAGGKHAKYRAVKVFFLWYEREYEPDDWKNPIHKVKPPKVPEQIIEGITIEQVKQILSTCDSTRFSDVRDRAMILFLLDTGVRVQEMIDLNRDDLLEDGSVHVRKGKGGKARFTYMGNKTRRAMRKYFRHRKDSNPAVFVNQMGERIAKSTIQGMLNRRCQLVGVPRQSPHDFRRAFVLNMLRSKKVDVYDLKMLTGHTTLEVLGRYAAKAREDAQTAHEEGSPVDRLL